MRLPIPTAADEVLDDISEGLLRLYPENAAYLGIDTADRTALKSRLTDRSPKGVADAKDHVTTILRSLYELDGAAVPSDQRLDLDVAAAAYAYAREGLEFGFGEMACLNVNLSHRSTPYVVAQNTGAVLEIPEFLDSQHGISDSHDADAYIERMHAYGEALDGETARIRVDLDLGVVLPDFLLHKTIGQLKAVRDLPADQWQVVASLNRPGRNLPEHLEAAKALVAAELRPALGRQIEALERAVPRATSDAGVWKLPDGGEYYDWALRMSTTTAIGAEQVHKMGLDQLRELHARMEPLLRRRGLTGGSIPERMEALAIDPANLYPNDYWTTSTTGSPTFAPGCPMRSTRSCPATSW